jgi:dTDP-4-dehydrorhamnose 3,5-epimerase
MFEVEVLKRDKYYDDRGFLSSTWQACDAGLNIAVGSGMHPVLLSFVEDRISQSKYGTIRGFHGDYRTWKLVSCLYGKFKLVTYNLKSRNKQEHILSSSDQDFTLVLIPPGVVNAHQCLSDECVLGYKWSEYYTCPEDQISIYYNDETINPKWVHTDGVLVSERDRHASRLPTSK